MRYFVFILALLALFRLAGCAHPVKAVVVTDVVNCTLVACREPQ